MSNSAKVKAGTTQVISSKARCMRAAIALCALLTAWEVGAEMASAAVPEAAVLVAVAFGVPAAPVGQEAVAAVVTGSAPPTYTVTGTASGVVGSGLVLRNNGADDLQVSHDGTFAFTTALTSGSGYSVTVATQPSSPRQNCTVAHGSGSVGEYQRHGHQHHVRDRPANPYEQRSSQRGH